MNHDFCAVKLFPTAGRARESIWTAALASSPRLASKLRLSSTFPGGRRPGCAVGLNAVSRSRSVYAGRPGRTYAGKRSAGASRAHIPVARDSPDETINTTALSADADLRFGVPLRFYPRKSQSLSH
jgi:hypothetical protein